MCRGALRSASPISLRSTQPDRFATGAFQRCALELSFCSAHLRHNHKTASLRLNQGMNGDSEQDLQAAEWWLDCAKREGGAVGGGIALPQTADECVTLL